MAVVCLLSSGEPALALPDVTLALGLLDHIHPPINADKDHQSDTPLDRDQDQINPAKNQEPKAAMLAFNVGQLNICAAALGTLLI